MGDAEHIVVRVENRIADVAAAAWDGCANPSRDDGTRIHPYNPFISHAFLKALEDAGCVDPKTGWMPQHLVIEDGSGGLKGAMPCYLKSHSMGEYVFDYAWADAFERAGGRYYPKLQVCVPFTPVTGRRFLAAPGAGSERIEEALLSGAIELVNRIGASSLHVTFSTEEEWRRQENKIKGVSFTRGEGRKFNRLFFSGAVEADPDRQGRILLPKMLKEFAQIKQDVVFVGVSTHVEIWAKERWRDFFEGSRASFEDIAEHLLES